MTTFSVERALLGTHEIFDLRDNARRRHVRIARRGAGVMCIQQEIDGTWHQLTDGYRDGAELDARPSSRFAVMVPFANRIADARYVFDGVSHDLQPGVEGVQRASRHGFVRGIDFDVVQSLADDSGARLVLKTSAIRPDAFPGYPFAIDLTVTYTLDADGLALEAVMRNVGEKAAPCFFGWHPYFRIGESSIEGWQLEISASKLIATDADFIPLSGADAYILLDRAPSELDFRKPMAIGKTEINHGYADLAHDADGRIRTRLRDPVSGIGIAMWQERGVVLAFTADTVTRDVRRSVALEPMESMSDAFNRPDCADAIRLEPGAERRFRCGVEIEIA
jgi:aldose 1-epimerase